MITNYHAFLAHERGDAARLTKAILTKGEPSPFIETPDQIVRRICRDLAGKKNIVVINDEAHHCYRRKPDAETETLTGEERQEAQKRDEEARVWITGLEAVKKKIGVKAIYDLSATPFFLKGSGYPEALLFPIGGEPKLPAELQGALHSLYDNYRQSFERWETNAEAQARGLTAPVFVVVCNNTSVSKMVFDYVAGWTKKIADDLDVIVPGQMALFNALTHLAGLAHREKLNVRAQGFGDDVHVAPRAVPFLANLSAQLVFSRQRLEVLLGRQSWQNLLYSGEPQIESFEMCFDHAVVHRPHVLGKEATAP